MSHTDPPLGQGQVPDKVLEELLAAFAGDVRDGGEAIDFDDPSIDELLGLAPSEAPPPAVEDVGPPVESIRPLVADEAATETALLAATAPPRRTIRIGGNDDDFIEAVYLDEEGADRLRNGAGRATEASVERTTILIGDDEIEGSSGGIPLATGPTSMDPRLRARRIAVKRALGRRRLKWFLLGGFVVIVVTGALALLGSSLFAVKQVYPSGVTGNTKGAYDAAVAELQGRPVLLVNTSAIESKLEKNPWIREARVTTDFPNSASIEIVERIPLATYQGTDGRFRVIDVEGTVVTVLDGQPLEFILITGPGADAEAGGAAGDALRSAAELVEALSPAARSRTEKVVVSDAGELSLRFANTDVVLGSPVDLLDKLTRLEAVLTRSDADKLTLINVSTPEIGYK